MKVVHVLAGAGESYDCPNCRRDKTLLETLPMLGVETAPMCMYLPLFKESQDLNFDFPLFFGAVNVYLQEKSSFFRRTPRWIDRIFDTPNLLRWVGQKAQSTEPKGFEEMTLSMLSGDKGRQVKELERFVRWLVDEGKPDIVHISNALLMGLAKRIRIDAGVPVVCTLQDENLWVDAMNDPYRNKVWQTMANTAMNVDAFIAVSHYFADFMSSRMALPSDKLFTVHSGLDWSAYKQVDLCFDPPVLGYFSSSNDLRGLTLLVDAFLQLKKEPRFYHLKFRAAGCGVTNNQSSINQLQAHIATHGFQQDVEFLSKSDRKKRIDFFSSITVLSNPTDIAEAFGMYIIEAMACGVPVVQTRVGSYPELLKDGGGLLVDSDSPEDLVKTLGKLLSQKEVAVSLGNQGRKIALSHFTSERMSREMHSVYTRCIENNLKQEGVKNET